MFTNGRFFLVLGIIFLLIGFFTNTTISTSLGEVHNLGLMNEKQNYIILGGFLLLAGVILQSKTSRKSDVEEDVKKDSAMEQKNIAGVVHQKKTLKESISGLTRDKKLGLQASLFFSFFVSIFILITLVALNFDLVYYFSIFIPVALSLYYSLNSSDEINASLILIKFTKNIAYTFIAFCTLWLIVMGFYLHSSMSGSDIEILLDPTRYTKINQIKTYFYVAAPTLFSLAFAIIPIIFAKLWTKTLK
tara:strand:+ start:1010 stop:1750 length:741 start_codon:yes stop_codon:yes gene_type:complete